MEIRDKRIIKEHLDRALENNSPLICVLKNGLTETKDVRDFTAPLYHKIEFRPDLYYKGYWSGMMFYPNGKSQGVMDFSLKSFVSVVCLEED